MTIYQWVTLGLGALGFLGTWILGAFYLGRAVEQMRAAMKEYIDAEHDKVLEEIEELRRHFAEEQKIQDHNFGEVGAAMREKISQVEQDVRKIELYGERHYVQKGEFEKATDRMTEAIKSMGADIKADLRERIEDLSKRIEQKPTQQ